MLIVNSVLFTINKSFTYMLNGIYFRGILKVEQRLLMYERNYIILYLYITIIVIYVNINMVGMKLFVIINYRNKGIPV